MPKMKLSDIGSLSRGKSKHRPRNDKILYGGKYPFVQTSDIKNANHILQTYEQTYNEIGLKQSKLWSKNTICITIAANIADSAILGFDACFPDSVIGLTVNDKIANYHYVEYLLQYYKRIIQNQSNGTSQENINLETFEQVYFDIPSLDIQNDISNILYSIDKKIELNNKINSELEHFAKTLYEYWFVQFDFPDENERPYKSSGGAMVYNEVLKRRIPANFEVIKLKDICEVKSGYPFSSEDYDNNGEFKLITIKNVQDNYISSDTDNNIGNIPDNMPDYCLLKEGNILLSLTGNVGRIGISFEDKLLLNQRVGLLKLKNIYYHSFIYLTFLSKYFKDTLEKISTGSNQKNLSPVETEKIPIIYSKTVLEQFEILTKPIIDKIINNYKENKQLTQLRDFLLPMLMNGQVTIQ